MSKTELISVEKHEPVGLPARQPQYLTIEEMKARDNKVMEMMKHVLEPGKHFGKIPGCGDKPALFKAGSERLLSAFRISAIPEVEDICTADEVKYLVIVRGYSLSGDLLGAGVGECSSSEDKYKWKKPVCREEWEATPEDRRRSKWKKGSSSYEELQIRTNPADLANTVLKMAHKRGLVAMTFIVTGCSDLFVQDMEDLEKEIREVVLSGEQADAGEEQAMTFKRGQKPAARDERMEDSRCDSMIESVPIKCRDCGHSWAMPGELYCETCRWNFEKYPED